MYLNVVFNFIIFNILIRIEINFILLESFIGDYVSVIDDNATGVVIKISHDTFIDGLYDYNRSLW